MDLYSPAPLYTQPDVYTINRALPDFLATLQNLQTLHLHLRRTPKRGQEAAVVAGGEGGAEGRVQRSVKLHETSKGKEAVEAVAFTFWGQRASGVRRSRRRATFMDIKAALITTSKLMANLGKNLGFIVSHIEVKLSFAESSACNTALQLPNFASVASQLLGLLGLRAQPLDNANSFELVLLHIGGELCMGKDENSRGYLDWIEVLVGEIKTLMKPGTKAYDHLYLSLILGYGAEDAIQRDTNDSDTLCLEPVDRLPPNLRALRPRQTY